MAVLGDAIASHLSKLRGLYSVELPIALEDDIIELVQACDAVSPRRAILVTNIASSKNVPITSWVEILKWRTDDDRVFVWARGSRDPDSSFRSAVKPFISGRFPGDQGCECTLDLLAEISIRELWKRRNRQGIDEAFEVFLRTSRWVAGILRHAFEQGGSTLNVHWSDKFLIHWAKLLELLNQEISNFSGVLEPRHAWEILRLAGLPVPDRLAQGSNPFWSAPADFPERYWQSVANKWQKAAEEFMQSDGKIAVLLTALDTKVPGTRKISPWRELRWDILQSLSPDAVAPERGMAVFTAAPSSTMLSKQFPQYPVAPVHSWWGVTDLDIEEAAGILRSSISFQPETSCTSLIPVFSSRSEEYWLDISKGIPTYNVNPRKWVAQLEVQNIQMLYRENWRNLFVSLLPPGTMRDGDAWINPDTLTLRLNGKELEVVNIRALVGPGGQLTLHCDIRVNYTATIKNNADTSSIDIVSGSWNPLWSLRLKATVQDCIDGNWGAKRAIDAFVPLVIPSPYSPTIFVLQERNIIFTPDSGDTFTTLLGSGNTWSSFSTPDILLQEEGQCEISVYDGGLDPLNPQFAQKAIININGTSLTPTSGRLWNTVSDLDDGDVFGTQDPSGTRDVAVVKVKERARNYSSGLLSVMRGRPAGRRQPSSQVRGSLLGQYQDQVTMALSKLGNNIPNSLYQYIVSSAENPVTWPSHVGTPLPEFLFKLQPGFSLPGIGNGPSSNLVSCLQWQKFMKSLAMICSNIGLNLAPQDFWLSGFDPSAIKTSLLKEYVEAHRELIQFAKTVSLVDTFWSSYPFSLIVVDGASGASLGQLLAVLLSPLHPARLAWAFSVAFTAKQGGSSQGLLGFVEGWNIPYTGFAMNSTGQEIPLVAVPTDPGTEQDFAAWSALAVLTHTGLAELPASAASLPLPWGGRTGINHKVVERAIKDYLNVHPHINSLEADIRSVTKAPRSQEIDNALLQFLGAGKISEMHKLSGGTRIWDSEDRLGTPPTRDNLFQARNDNEYERTFEWRSYSPESLVNSDVAFVENANVHLAITNGETSGILGPLPLRRFCPPILKGLDQGNLVLDQNYSVHPDDDLLGLSSLLAEMEQDGIKALRSSPQSHALGIGQNARWEVLGTFNMDPALLSSVIAKTTNTHSADKRLLWEWRPSWLNQERRSENELAKRPYYVVARVPASLLKALEYRQGFSEKQAGEVLSELGYRGVGLASLYATGGSQESAAAGFFYAMRLLLPLEKHPLQPKWTTSKDTRTIYGLLPVDPVYSVLSELAGTPPSDRRADLLVLQITQESEDFSHICLIPIEIKHHGNPQNPEAIPPDTDLELKRAREQLGQMSMMIESIGKSLHVNASGNNNVVNCYTKRLGFAMLLELAMSLTRVPIQADNRGKITNNILNGRIAVSVGDQVLLWFAPSSTSVTGDIHFVDPHGLKMQNNHRLREIFLDPTAIPGLWWNDSSAPPGPNEESIRNVVDVVMEEVISACVSDTGASTTNLRTELMELLGLGSISTVQDDGQGTPASDDEVTVTRPDSSAETTEQPTTPEHVQETESKSKDMNIGKNAYGLLSLWDEETEEGLSNSTPSSRFAATGATTLASIKDVNVPRSLVGWDTVTSRWTLLGNLEGTNEFVALDFDHPKTIGIFGYMGSGKTYLLGTLIEAALEVIPGINSLALPLSVVIFNYRRNASDRFELSSLIRPNKNKSDINRLTSEYGANSQALQNIHVLCLPGQRNSVRLSEYEGIPSSELLFDPSSLTVEDWELLMGDPGSGALFARTIRHALGELRALGEITLEKLEEYVLPLLPTGSRRSADIRFRFVRKYISSTQGIKFEQILKPGRAVIIDLRDALFTKEDALRFFLVCANHISRVQGQFNKMVIFDEAHEYLSNEFGEKIEARIRLMRHEGTSYIFATQDVGSIPSAIQRFITTKFVFSLGTRQNIEDLMRFAPEFKNQQLLGIRPGYCLIQANESIGDMFRRPRLVRIRPRVTQHGGDTQIFSKEGEERQ